MGADEWVFPSGYGHSREDNGAGAVPHMTPQAVYYIVKTMARACGIARLGPHDLRRTWAKQARAHGAALEQISLVLGHASVKTTEIYLGGGLLIEAGKAATDSWEPSGA